MRLHKLPLLLLLAGLPVLGQPPPGATVRKVQQPNASPERNTEVKDGRAKELLNKNGSDHIRIAKPASGDRLVQTLPQLSPRAPGRGEVSQISVRLPFTDEDRTVWVKKSGHNYLYQGDIIVASDAPRAMSHGLSPRLVPGSGLLWPNGEIPIVIDKTVLDDVDQLESVYDAINALMRNTKIRLVPRTNQRDYVRIHKGYLAFGAAASWVGRAGGEQDLILNSGIPIVGGGTILHELLHAAGMHHEHSRLDRDKFVRLHLEGMGTWERQNFDKMLGRSFGEYDYASIMHYDKHAFGTGGKQTIYCRTGGIETACPEDMGQREALTEQDITGLNALYSSVNRGSGGGWDATLTRAAKRAGWYYGKVQGTVRWQRVVGMPQNVDPRGGTVDYLRIVVEEPTTETIRWSGGRKARTYAGWKRASETNFRTAATAGAEIALPYDVPVMSEVPLRMSFEIVEGQWAGLPAPSGVCENGPARCRYELSASSTAGNVRLERGGSATIDYRIEGHWRMGDMIRVPPALAVNIDPGQQVLQVRDRVLQPIKAVHRLDGNARSVQVRPVR